MAGIRFEQPEWLPLLAVPAMLLLLWTWQLTRRRGEVRRVRKARRVPVGEHFSLVGDLAFWLALLLAVSASIVALARPVAVISRVHTAGIDLVVLQDGSASMRARDVRGDRWQRSMRFLRVLGESLRWERDRVALTLFAHIATPQIRLTRDPNTLFFFLDHLEEAPPFRLQDAGTWDTNIERGIGWGLRLVEKDAEILGPSTHAQGFLLISDGQAWSGEAEAALERLRARDIPIHVVGVGTTAGAVIPDPDSATSAARQVTSALDRTSLTDIAVAGGGRYFELDREPDSDIANTIIDSLRRRAPTVSVAEDTKDLYWYALAAAAACLLIGVLTLGDRTALALHLGVAAAVLIWIGLGV